MDFIITQWREPGNFTWSLTSIFWKSYRSFSCLKCEFFWPICFAVAIRIFLKCKIRLFHCPAYKPECLPLLWRKNYVYNKLDIQYFVFYFYQPIEFEWMWLKFLNWRVGMWPRPGWSSSRGLFRVEQKIQIRQCESGSSWREIPADELTPVTNHVGKL
jgi:hypothetical protein